MQGDWERNLLLSEPRGLGGLREEAAPVQPAAPKRPVPSRVGAILLFAVGTAAVFDFASGKWPWGPFFTKDPWAKFRG